MFLHFPCLLPNRLTHFQWRSLWKCQPVSALLKGTRNSGSRLGPSVEGGEQLPLGASRMECTGEMLSWGGGASSFGGHLLGTWCSPGSGWKRWSRGRQGRPCHARLRTLGYWQVSLLPFCSVALSCPTLCNPVDRSPPGSSIHGDSPGKNTGVDCHVLLQGIFPTQGSN